MISIKGLTKHYGPFIAVSDLSFDVRAGEVMGFLGPNGAGKTTTLRILSGFLAPTSGTAEVAGHDIAESGLEMRRRIGYLPENNPLYEDMDVGEYLEWAAAVRGFEGEGGARRVRSSVEACGIGDVLARPIGLLSKGYRQRVGLAAAILHDPDVLLLDEPTSGLDPNQSREVRELIRRLKEAKTVLISTHILPEVEATCDRVVILHKGRIAAQGTPKDLMLHAGRATTVRMTLKAEGLDRARVEDAVRGIEGIEGLELREEQSELSVSLELSKDAADPREALFRLAVQERWTLLELARVQASLESVFKELTLS